MSTLIKTYILQKKVRGFEVIIEEFDDKITLEYVGKAPVIEISKAEADKLKTTLGIASEV